MRVAVDVVGVDACTILRVLSKLTSSVVESLAWILTALRVVEPGDVDWVMSGGVDAVRIRFTDVFVTVCKPLVIGFDNCGFEMTYFTLDGFKE
jgi:hypothetical protein